MTSANRKTVCVDLDGVLARYDGWKGDDHIGDPIPGAVESVTALAKFARVTIHSIRLNPVDPITREPRDNSDRVGSWLRANKFPPVTLWLKEGKPIAAAYVDDRAVVCCPQQPYKELHGAMRIDGCDANYTGWFDAALSRCRKLCEV